MPGAQFKSYLFFSFFLTKTIASATPKGSNIKGHKGYFTEYTIGVSITLVARRNESYLVIKFAIGGEYL